MKHLGTVQLIDNVILRWCRDERLSQHSPSLLSIGLVTLEKCMNCQLSLFFTLPMYQMRFHVLLKKVTMIQQSKTTNFEHLWPHLVNAFLPSCCFPCVCKVYWQVNAGEIQVMAKLFLFPGKNLRCLPKALDLCLASLFVIHHLSQITQGKTVASGLFWVK